MLQAYSKDKELVLASQIERHGKKKKYYCPSCEEEVYLKQGNIKISHFSHYRYSNCQNFSEGETEEHLCGKLLLKTFFEKIGKEVILEPFLKRLNQRPDLLVIDKGQKPLAIEFQCSSLSQEKWLDRTQGYLNEGMDLVWILGEKFHYKGQLTPFMKLCMKDFESHDLIGCFQLNSHKRILEFLHSYKKIDSNQMSFEKMSYSIDLSENYKQIIMPSPRNNKGQTLNYLEKNLKTGSLTSRQFFKLIYENHETIISLPNELYCLMPNEWMIKGFSFEWKYKLLLWVESHEKFCKIFFKDLEKLIDDHRFIDFYPMPLVDKKKQMLPILEFFHQLVSRGLLKETQGGWIYLKRARRFSNIEEKIAFFEVQ